MFQGLLRPMHLLVILGIVLIIFGPGKLSELGSSLGKSIRGFKNAMKEPTDAIKNITDEVKSDFKNIDKK
ncbi:MAG: twin-arginine translocase TatA/TatE family subunit [Smithella sp.]|jgi:sec-independent protein translocase protein TatA